MRLKIVSDGSSHNTEVFGIVENKNGSETLIKINGITSVNWCVNYEKDAVAVIRFCPIALEAHAEVSENEIKNAKTAAFIKQAMEDRNMIFELQDKIKQLEKVDVQSPTPREVLEI